MLIVGELLRDQIMADCDCILDWLQNPTGPPFRIDVKPVPLYIPEVVL